MKSFRMIERPSNNVFLLQVGVNSLKKNFPWLISHCHLTINVAKNGTDLKSRAEDGVGCRT